MKLRGLSWGIFLVIIGALLVLRNFNFLEFDIHWSELVRYWPVALIFIGISSLTKTEALSKFQWLVPVIMIVTVVLILVKGVNWGTTENDFSWHHSDSSDTSYSAQNFNVELKPETKIANLVFEGGAASFAIEDTTNQLLQATTTFKGSQYMLENVHTDSLEDITLKMNNNHFKFKDGEFDNNVVMKLNTNPIWTMDFSIGAGDVMFDLSKYKIKELKMDAGAAALDIKLGGLIDNDVEINAGASSVTLRIPENVNCNLKLDAVLSSKNLEGLKKVNDNKYESETFDPNAKTLTISIDAGVSSVDIIRY